MWATRRTSLTGSVVETCVSLAYGDALSCAGSDVSPLHFTGKMRDTETGLDEFPARYYSSVQGRWYSPDWASAQVPVPYADLHNPQTLNLYDYVGGDPTNHADADGHSQGPGMEGQNACSGNQQCAENKQGQAEEQAGKAQNKYDPNKTGPEDPTNPGKPLYQNPTVQKASDQAFMTTTNGQARSGLAEAGFSIEYKDGKISIGNKVDSVHGDGKANELRIKTDDNTIAILHTHGNKALPTPSMPTKESPGDVGSRFPNFVRSQSALYVTVPGTTTYIQLVPAPSN